MTLASHVFKLQASPAARSSGIDIGPHRAGELRQPSWIDVRQARANHAELLCLVPFWQGDAAVYACISRGSGPLTTSCLVFSFAATLRDPFKPFLSGLIVDYNNLLSSDSLSWHFVLSLLHTIAVAGVATA